MRTTIEQIPQLPARPAKSWQEYLLESILGIGGALAITVLIDMFHLYPTIPNISMVYLLLILALATTRGRYAALLAAIVAFLSFDFFLVPPFFSFTISRWEEWIALFVFLVTALIASQLATRSRQSIERARLREREARILYEVGHVVNSTDDLDEQLDSIVLALVRVFSPWGVRECALLLPDEDGLLRVRADAPIRIEHFTLSPDEMVEAREVMADGIMSEVSPVSSHAQSAPVSGQPLLLRLLPLKDGNKVLGVLALRLEQAVSWLVSEPRLLDEQGPSTDQATFFWTFLNEAIMKIERARSRV
ncbi:MAG TPA: DUF4118 domain-containing protein [Ktedonobacteraceae bacterium]|nr:DUF4118 domain-containing protein [Ktedonobacteraceae bacterium]